jgi:hypothetical protein
MSEQVYDKKAIIAGLRQNLNTSVIDFAKAIMDVSLSRIKLASCYSLRRRSGGKYLLENSNAGSERQLPQIPFLLLLYRFDL